MVTAAAGVRTRVQAALVAVGACQDEAAMAGVTRLREGRRGVDGIAAPKDVSRVEKLHVGHRLWRHGDGKNSSGYYGNTGFFVWCVCVCVCLHLYIYIRLVYKTNIHIIVHSGVKVMNLEVKGRKYVF